MNMTMHHPVDPCRYTNAGIVANQSLAISGSVELPSRRPIFGLRADPQNLHGQWSSLPFQGPKLRGPTINKAFFSENIPTKYGQKHDTVPGFQDPEDLPPEIVQ